MKKDEKTVAELQNQEGALVPQQQNEGGALAIPTPKFDPFTKPEALEGIIHKVGNPLEVICDCGSAGGFKFALKEGINKTLDFILLYYKEIPNTHLFPKTYKTPQDWVLLFGIIKVAKKHYFIQMLIKGESRDSFANLQFKLQTEQVRSIDVWLKLSMKDKTSLSGKPYKIVEFETEEVEDEALKSEIYDFVTSNGGLEEVCKSSFLENILKNAPVVFGEVNPEYEGEMPVYEKKAALGKRNPLGPEGQWGNG